MEILIIAALIGLLPATIAKNKGRSFGLWWLYGALLFIVALPHALLLKSKLEAHDGRTTNEGIKKSSYEQPVRSQIAEDRMNPTELFEGQNGQITLSDEILTISRKGLDAFLFHGLKGDKRIPYSSITAVQFKEGRMGIGGYIQFTIMGGVESRGGFSKATRDENTVMFRPKHNDIFRRLRDEVEKRISAAKSPKFISSTNSSAAEQLSKLADLLDRGLVTETEFLAEKSRVLSN